MRQLIFGLIAIMFSIILFNAEVCLADAKASVVEEISYAIASWYGPNFHGRQTASGQT
jgi:rare lipoprotein A (peptidoglycan hydrolase)